MHFDRLFMHLRYCASDQLARLVMDVYSIEMNVELIALSVQESIHWNDAHCGGESRSAEEWPRPGRTGMPMKCTLPNDWRSAKQFLG
jgi:hypothetical protein